MGYYVNPTTGETKEAWLKRNGSVVFNPTFNASSPKALVCLVDNGMFKAAGVAYSADELNAFNLPQDTRSKVWYEVEKALLIPHVQPPLEMSTFE